MIIEKQDLVVDLQPIVVLRFEGLIKLGESAAFFFRVFEERFANANVVLNFQKIDYIDSTGIGELLGVCIALGRQGKKIVLVHPSDSLIYLPSGRIDALVRIAHATGDIRRFPDEGEAVHELAIHRANVTPSVEGQRVTR